MEKLILESSFKTPKIELDKNSERFIISGRSLPENAEEFYNKIIFWLQDYFLAPKTKTTFVFKLNYYNTASSKMILEIFKVFKRAHDKGIELELIWGHDKNDEEVKEDGKDFADIVGIPIIIKTMDKI